VDLRLSAARQWQDSNEFGRVDRDPLSATLTLNQMLYDGFFTRSEVRRLGHARLVRYYELLEAAERAALEAIRAYADVERHRELVFLAEENYRAHRDVFGQVENSRGRASAVAWTWSRRPVASRWRNPTS
jgi:outer membrane protein, adhesin transport system